MTAEEAAKFAAARARMIQLQHDSFAWEREIYNNFSDGDRMNIYQLVAHEVQTYMGRGSGNCPIQQAAANKGWENIREMLFINKVYPQLFVCLIDDELDF